MEVDWLNINPMTGGTGQTEIYAYVTENEKIGCTRTAQVRFTNGEGLFADLNLSQTSNTEDMRFVLTPDTLSVEGAGGTFYVNVLSNTYWKVSDYTTGLTITSDNEEGYGDGILTITFPRNPSTSRRNGVITVNSHMGERTIQWTQAAYNAITVTPNSLNFSQTGETKTVTVKSSGDWTLASYDSAHTTFSPISGHSGETVVTVTKQPLTQTQITYYVTKPSTAVFSDGINTAKLSINSTLDDYYIDDDYLTVTYNVPSANTEIAIFNIDYDVTDPPTEKLYQDDDWSNERSEFHKTGATTAGWSVHLVTYATPGLHTIKYKFGGGKIMPKYFLNAISVYSIVVGNKCSGSIGACSAMYSGAKEVILGLGNITLIGEYAFYGCGSTGKDFVLGNNVKNYVYQPFHKMKARRFIYDRTELGGTGSTQTQAATASSVRKMIISGSTYTWDSNNTVTGNTTFCGWSDGNGGGYPGDISCGQLVIGENVSVIHNTPFYPFGIYMTRVSANCYSAEYQYASTSYLGSTSAPDSRITGWGVPSIACVSSTSPSVDNYAFTPVTQSFQRMQGQVRYGVFRTATFGTGRNIPLHYPIGADYSAWSGQWTNLMEDLDL